MAFTKKTAQLGALKKELLALQQGVDPARIEAGVFRELAARVHSGMGQQEKELRRLHRDLKRTRQELADLKERSAVTVHDLKVPVTISVLNLELAEMETDPGERENYLVGVRRELEFLLDTIGNMLDLQQADFGPANLKLQQTELRPLVDNVIHRMRVVIRDKPDLTFRNEIAADLPPVLADRHKLTRVYNNLLSNAIKYTEKGTITAGGGLSPQPDKIRLFVADTGLGIEPDRLPLLFDFFQGDEMRLDSSGVGLAFVKQVILGHEGRVWLESKKGVGTTVVMEFPVGGAGEGVGIGKMGRA